MSSLFSPIKQMLANEPVTFTEKGLASLDEHHRNDKWFVHAINADKTIDLISEYHFQYTRVPLDYIEHPHAKTPLWMLQHIMSMCEDADTMFEELAGDVKEYNLNDRQIESLYSIAEEIGGMGITLEETINEHKVLLKKLSS